MLCYVLCYAGRHVFEKKEKQTKKKKTRAYAVVMVTSLYHLFFCYNSIKQKYHHYQQIKSPNANFLAYIITY